MKKSDRISLPFIRSIDEKSGFNTGMFKEDFAQNVSPLYPRNDDILYTLNPSNDEIVELISDLLPAHHYRRDLKKSVIESISLIAKYLLNTGMVVLELVKETNYGERITYNLCVVPGNVRVGKNHIYQIISEEDSKKYACHRKVKIPKSKCFVIKFPTSLGGRKKYIKHLEKINALDKTAPMLNVRKNTLIGYRKYDVKLHNKLHELDLWRISKTYSWPHRSSFGKLFSGHYVLMRHFNFRINKLILRDHIISSLTDIITDVLSRSKMNIEISIKGKLTIADVEEKKLQWENGTLDPNTVSEVI